MIRDLPDWLLLVICLLVLVWAVISFLVPFFIFSIRNQIVRIRELIQEEIETRKALGKLGGE